MKKTFESKSGSALLVTLLVVSLLLVVVVTFSAYVRMELRAVNARMELIQARQNAKLGMHLALARLQETAGPDQRVTARAEILDSALTGGNQYWTGVWSSSLPASSTPVAWLVSSSSGNPDPISNSFSELLIGSETLGTNVDEYVYAESVTVNNNRFSWVVQDLGVKANISTLDRVDDINTAGYQNINSAFTTRDSWRLEHAKNMSPSISDLSPLLPPEPNISFTHDKSNINKYTRTGDFLNRLSEWGDMAHISQLGISKAFVETLVQNYYHNLTTSSSFLLSNTLDGGLRQDLTHLRRMATPSQLELDTAFSTPKWEYLTPAVWEFTNFGKLPRFSNFENQRPNQMPGFVITPALSTDYETSLVGFTTAPLATEFAWNAGLGIRSGPTSGVITRDIYLYFYNIVEMLNPFGAVLDLNNGSGAWPENPGDLQVRISNFPEIVIRNTTAGVSHSLDLSDFVVAVNSNSYNTHAPGYMRTNFSPTGSYNSVTGNRVGVFAVKIGEFPATPATRDVFRVEFGSSDLRIEISENNTNARSISDRRHWAFFLTNRSLPSGVPRFTPGNDPSGAPRILQTFTLQNWGNFIINYPSGDQTRFVHGGSNMDRNRLSRDSVNFGVHLKLVDEWVDVLADEEDPQPLDDFMAYSDFRWKEVVIDMDDRFSGDGQYFDAKPPINVSRSAFVNTTDIFHGAYFGSVVNNRRAILMDFPTQEPLSVGALNHLTFSGFPFQPLGNLPLDRLPPTITGTGNGPDQSLNNFFDRYFFSSLPENTANWDGLSPLPNQRVLLADPDLNGDALLGSPASGVALQVKGGLNINSLSPAAWNVILHHSDPATLGLVGSNMSGGGLLSSLSRSEEPIQGVPFFQHAFTGHHHTYSNSVQSYAFVNAANASTLGQSLKSTPSHEAMIQGIREVSSEDLTLLAEQISNEISLFTQANQRPFLSLTEFLNHGVLQRAIDAVPSLNTPDGKRIPTLAPAYFSVGSLLNHLAPILFSRSDTFVIRSSGSVGSSVTNDTLSKAFLETTVQRVPHISDGVFGRRFEIVSSKWINVTP